MLTFEPGQKEFIVDLSRDVIARIAPSELPLFEPLCREYFRNPEKLIQKASGDPVLGFGGELNTATLMTFFVLPVVGEVTKTILKDTSKLVGKRGYDRMATWLRRKLNRPASSLGSDPAELQFNREQLKQVRQAAYYKALALDLPEERAALLAEAIAGCLALNLESHPSGTY